MATEDRKNEFPYKAAQIIGLFEIAADESEIDCTDALHVWDLENNKKFLILQDWMHFRPITRIEDPYKADFKLITSEGACQAHFIE